MTFVTYQYFAFLAISLILYYILPWRNLRVLLLLTGSFLFCLSLNFYSTVWLFATAILSYLVAVAISKSHQVQKTKRAKVFLIGSLLIAFGSLFLMKYLPMTTEMIEKNVEAVEVSFLAIAMPVGISFYLFQVTGYLIDVYQKKTEAIRSVGQYMLAVTFFPKLTQGPIAPVCQLADQFSQKVALDPILMRKGALRILFGLFKKVVIADRLAVVVDHIFAEPTGLNASTVVIGAIFYTFQLYTDFAGYTDVALGSAQLFGFELPENFRQPYLARSIADFWRRWHQTLSAWLKTYIYFPLGGSRVGQIRWAINVLIVFLVSGMWHGSGVNFIIWGLLHGMYQVIGKYTATFRGKFKEKLMGKDTWLSSFTSVICTFAFVCIAWVFFRASSIGDVYEMFLCLLEGNWEFSLTQLGVAVNEWKLSVFLILLTVVLDLVAEHISILDSIENRSLPVRWIIYLVLLFVLILFGMYGSLSAQSFIYVSF